MRTDKVVVAEMRNRSSTDVDSRIKSTNLSRSRSAQSLKMMADQTTLDDKMTVLSQLFWIAVSLLESDYEYEFLLAMRLMEKVSHIKAQTVILSILGKQICCTKYNIKFPI